MLLGIFLVMALFAACNKEKSQSAESPGPSKETLVVVANQEIVSADPADQAQLVTSQFMYNYLEPLMYMDEKNVPRYRLAENIKEIDGTTYEVTLRKGVKFHNGEELKAKDVIFSFKRALQNSKTATNLGEIDANGFTEIDDYTLRMKTKVPVATFYAILCHSQSSILSEKGVTGKGSNFSHDASGCGTGPYQFVEWENGVQVILERFDDYWGNKAKMKRIEWKFVPDANSRNVMLEAGEADVILQVQTAGIEALIANPDVTVHTIPSTTIRFLYMNQSPGLPLSNKALRQAIAYAIDRDGLVNNVFKGYSTSATSFLAPGVLGHTDDIELYNYDPEKAKAKLTEAGYAPGQLSIKLSMHSQNIQYAMAEIIQANLADVGINMEIEGLDTAAWIAALAEGKTHMGFNTNSNTRADPDALYTPVYSGNRPAPNHGCVNDPKLDELVVNGRRAFDRSEREKIYIEAQRIISNECYFYPLAYDNITTATRSDLKGFVLNPTSMQEYSKVYY
jgi:peptide/nickel transport system substrate-binding protein